MAQATQSHITSDLRQSRYYTTVLRTLASRFDWHTADGRRRIIYLSLRAGTTWPASHAWKVSGRWVEDTAR
jgi:hypothetical protein